MASTTHARAWRRRLPSPKSRWPAARGPWARTFTMADCAAAPALFYSDKLAPLAGTYPNLAAYLDRLKQRPSYARTLKEAEPYMQFFPKE